MLMPIFRLVVIYLALTAAVLAVFNRDRLLPMLFGSDEPVAAAPAATPVRPEPAPVQPPAVATPTAPQAAPLASPPAAMASPAEPVATPAAPAPDLAEAMNAARAAYWQGDSASAEAQLVALTEAHPDNADLLGELGNLEFALQAWDKAATAYHKAGLLLIDQGQQQQVMPLISVLRSIAPDKAADLGARLANR